MSEFNQFFTIFYRDGHGRIQLVLNNDGGILLYTSFECAKLKCDSLTQDNPQHKYIVHSIDINRDLFD